MQWHKSVQNNFQFSLVSFCISFLEIICRQLHYHQILMKKLWNKHCVKSVRIRSFSGPYYPAPKIFKSSIFHKDKSLSLYFFSVYEHSFCAPNLLTTKLRNWLKEQFFLLLGYFFFFFFLKNVKWLRVIFTIICSRNNLTSICTYETLLRSIKTLL